MPLIQSSTDALPYIDAAPSADELAAANALVQSELAAESQTSLHPNIPSFPQPKYSNLVDVEHARLASGEARTTGIDLSRYEALDAPATGDVEAWRTTLQKAYASAEYLKSRETNLGLLETYGKNAWLISNSQLADILKGLEKELADLKLEYERVEQERRERQASVAAEVTGLEKGWKDGVGRLIEVLAAAEGVKQEILQRRREGAR